MPNADIFQSTTCKFLTNSALALALAGIAVLADRPVHAQSSGKLTTVLADLAQSLAQAGGTSGSRRAASIDALPKSAQDAIRAQRLRIDTAGNVQVYILLRETTDDAVAQLAANGAVIEIRDPARRRVQAHVPAARLQAIALLPIVDWIRLPTYARRRAGAAETEGDAILHADTVRSQFGLDGTGVRVGVISDGLKGVFATGCTTCAAATGGPMASGDLPTATGVRNSSGVLTGAIGGIVGRSFQANNDLEGLPPASPVCGFAGAGAEGTALLEIVHDLAPGAKLSFANADTDLAFGQAVNFLAASNDVVLDDIGFYGEPYDGTSAVSANTAAALNNPAYPIRAYFTAVGNDADEHYYGTYVDSGVDGATVNGITTAGHLHLFQRTDDTTDVRGLGAQPYNLISLPRNGEVAIYLTWDDPFGASRNNYDLYLVQQSSGRVVARSTDVQNGAQDPVETIDYVNTGSDDSFRIVVQNVQNAAQPKHLNLFSFQPECAATGPQVLAPPRHERHNYNTAARSVAAQSDAAGSPAGVVAVGAICSASASAASTFPSSVPDESCLDTSNSTIEFFSSRGPTLDGRNKPDIAAIDGVTTTGGGGFGSPFFGTSAASPHMGGIAALLLQAAPCLLNRTASTIDPSVARTTIRNLLLGHAVSLSTPSPDTVFGAGRADAQASVQATLVARTGPSNLTFDGNTPFGASLTPDQLGFTDPNHCALTKLTWSGGCGTSPGSTMTCPFGTSSVNVSASNNGVGFSGAADLQITVTDFSLAASPAAATVSAGQTATAVVTLAPQGGPFRSSVTLACNNLPPQTTCSFDPPTLTPGTSVSSRLRISTTATTVSGSTNGLPTLVRARPQTSGIALFPSSVDFGSQTVGTSTPPKLVYLTNIGADPLNLTSVTASGDFTQVNDCATALAAGANCSVAVTFTPSIAGARSGTLSFVDDASGSPHSVALTGTGIAVDSTSTSTPSGTYAITIVGTAGTLAHSSVVTLTVQ